MSPDSPFLFVDIELLICLALAVAGVWIGGLLLSRRDRVGTRAPVQAPPAIRYRDPPTVRISSSQRVARVRRAVRVNVGEHVDVLDTPPGSPPALRLTLKAVVERDGVDAAHLRVQFGHTRMSCGPLVRELGLDEFIVARSVRDEPRGSIFHFSEVGDSLDFTRIKVRSVCRETGAADLDVMHVVGHWPASQREI